MEDNHQQEEQPFFAKENHDEKYFEVFCSEPENKLDAIGKYFTSWYMPNATRVSFDFFDQEPVQYFNIPQEFYMRPSVERLELSGCNVDINGLRKLSGLRSLKLALLVLEPSSVLTITKTLQQVQSLTLSQEAQEEENDSPSPADMILSFRSKSLTELVVDQNTVDEECWVILNVPQLRVLVYRGLMPTFETVVDMVNLRVVEIDFSQELRFSTFFAQRLSFLLEDLRHAETLSVCGYTLQLISQRSIRRVLKVRHLTLAANFHQNEFLGISMFLQRCPLLHILTVEDKRSTLLQGPLQFDFMQFWETVVVHECLRTLTSVSFKGYNGKKSQKNFLKYILRNAAIIKELHLYPSREAPERVQTYQRRSNQLQVLIH